MLFNLSASSTLAAVTAAGLLVLLFTCWFRALRNSAPAHVVAIILLFLLALIVRLPHINRPLSCHHEVLTAMSMITLENWQSQGALEHNCCLLQTYPRETDRFVMNRGMRLVDEAGKGYYTSFPPFSIILPYALFRVLRIEPSILGLQLLNLVSHLLAAILIYFAVVTIQPDRFAGGCGALLASAVFILLPANLWFFSNTYSWDIFWHYLWVGGLFLLARLDLAVSEGRAAGRLIALLAVVSFLLVYTDHYGLFFALSVLAYSLVRIRRSRYRDRLVFTILASSAGAVVLMLFQYSTIAGFQSLRGALLDSAETRIITSLCNPMRILTHYRYAYGPAIPVVILAVASLARRRADRTTGLSGREGTLLLMAAVPVLLHHIVFLEWTAVHDYSVLKASVFIALLAGTGLSRAITGGIRRTLRVCVVAGTLGLFVLMSLSMHQRHFTRCHEPDRYSSLGEAIRHGSSDDEVVFAVPIGERIRVDPRVIYYAGRNIQNVDGVREAREWLEVHGREKGIVFEITKGHRTGFVYRVTR